MPLPEKFDIVPPVAVMSPTTKSVLGAERVKVIRAVSLAPRAAALEVMVTVVATVLTASVRVPTVLSFPAASVKAAAGTVMVAAPLKPASGVKTAV